MDMVGKVKAAIRDAAVPHQGGTIACAPAFRSLSYYAGVGIDYFSHDPARLEALFDIAARAAIEAMRQPNGDMILRGASMTDDREGEAEARAHGVWWAMIDAALSDQPRPTEEKA